MICYISGLWTSLQYLERGNFEQVAMSNEHLRTSIFKDGSAAASLPAVMHATAPPEGKVRHISDNIRI